MMSQIYLWNLGGNALVTEIQGKVGDTMDVKVVFDQKPPEESSANEHPTLTKYPLKTKNESIAHLTTKELEKCYTLRLLSPGKTSIYVTKNYNFLLDISVFVDDEYTIQEKEEVARLAKEEAEKRQKAFNAMMITTTPSIPARTIIRHIGLARGGTVRAKHVGTDLLAGIKSGTVGGEIKGYSKLLSDAREEAIFRMKEDASKLGANAIIGMNFSTAVLDGGMAEMCAFGTAVVVEDE